jgi:hypothetical protein
MRSYPRLDAAIREKSGECAVANVVTETSTPTDGRVKVYSKPRIA